MGWRIGVLFTVSAACGDGGTSPRVDASVPDTSIDAPPGATCEVVMPCGTVGTASPTWQWDRRIAATQSVVPIDVAFTPNGGIVVIGQFTGDADFGGGMRTAAGGFDAFVLSLDADGNYRWDHPIATTGDDIAAAVVVDTCGNVYVSGGFAGTLDFGGGARTITGLSDAFVVSYAPGGTYRWDAKYAGSVAAIGERALGLAIDANDQLAVAGRFAGDIDLGLGPSTGSTSLAAFVAGIDPATGATVWNTFLRPNTGTLEVVGLVLDAAGAPTVSGRFSGTVDFGGGLRTAAGGTDAFAVRLDTSRAWVGDVVWGGTMGDQSLTVAAIGSSVAIGGVHRDVTTFDGGTLTTSGPLDSLLVGIDGTGAIAWSRRWTGTGSDGLAALATTSTDLFVAHGAITSGTVNFGGGDRTVAALTSACALVGYAADGTYQWDEFLGGTTGSSCVGVGVGGGRCGRLAAVGQLQGTVDFGGGARTSTGTIDGFVWVLGQ